MKKQIKESFAGLGTDLKRFGQETWKDFKHCWSVYPNVMIIMGCIILVALFV
jgi:hypothetical protein